MRCRAFTFWLNMVFYLKKSCSILLRKKYSIHYLHFSFEKHAPSQVLKDFSVENVKTTPSTFLSKFSSEIYLSRIINYWCSILTLYLSIPSFLENMWIVLEICKCVRECVVGKKCVKITNNVWNLTNTNNVWNLTTTNNVWNLTGLILNWSWIWLIFRW